MKLSIFKALVPSLLLLPLVACGGGGSSPEPAAVAQRVDLTVGLEESEAIHALDLTIVFPAGFTLEVDADGQPTALAFDQLPQDAYLGVNYTPETAQANGMLKLSLFSIQGFAGPTSLVTVGRVYLPASTLPQVADFTITLEARDLNGALLPPIAEKISMTATRVN